MLQGKRALVLGVANARSIAWGIADRWRREGAEVFVTYRVCVASPADRGGLTNVRYLNRLFRMVHACIPGGAWASLLTYVPLSGYGDNAHA